MALALAVREPGIEVRAGIGTPNSLVTKLAQRFGREPTRSRCSSRSRARSVSGTPPRSARLRLPARSPLHELARALHGVVARRRMGRSAPRSGGSASRPRGARLEPGRRRSRAGPRRAARARRGALVPWEARRLRSRRHRTAGVERLLRRWAERAGVEPRFAESTSRDASCSRAFRRSA